jgi:heterodisulfide reductase subunit A-like polyferredoxin
MERARPRVSASRTRKRFAEVELCLTDTEAVSEAKRCLRCGPCLECVQCHGYCPKHQVALHVPGSDEEVRIRFAGLDAWISDPGADREVAILRPGAGPMSAVAAPVVCSVDQTLCRDCGRCAEVCVHQAIKSLPWHGELKAASVDHLLCRGCGLCQAACPSGALRVGCLHEPALVLRESSR